MRHTLLFHILSTALHTSPLWSSPMHPSPHKLSQLGILITSFRFQYLSCNEFEENVTGSKLSHRGRYQEFHTETMSSRVNWMVLETLGIDLHLFVPHAFFSFLNLREGRHMFFCEPNWINLFVYFFTVSAKPDRAYSKSENGTKV